MTTDERAMRDGPWCLACGWPSRFATATLDPDRPIVYCTRVLTDVSTRCGRVQGTYHRAEGDRAYSARRWELTTAHHHQHDVARDPVPFCHKRQAVQEVLDVLTIGTDTAATQAAGASRKESRR